MPDLQHKRRWRRNHRIRLFFLIPSFKSGGAELQLLTLLRGLDKTQFAVVVAAIYRGSENDAQFEAVPQVSVEYLDKKWMLDFSPFIKLPRLLLKYRIDILQCYNISARLMGIFSAKIVHLPYVIATERTAKELFSSVGSHLYLLLEKFALRLADAVIANSQAGVAFVRSRRIKPGRIHLIYNGIDPERLQTTASALQVRRTLSIPESALVLGIVARMEPVKSPDVFIKVCGRLAERFPNVIGLLVGDGQLLPTLKTSAEQMGMASLFRFVGRRSNVADMIQVMDIVLMTSSQVEGCSNALLEAMALAKPVVATRVGGNEELIENEQNGILVQPDHLLEMTNAVSRLAADQTLRQFLGKNAQMSANRRFSNSVMVKEYEKILSRLKSQLIRPPNIMNSGMDNFSVARPFRRVNILDCAIDQMTLAQCLDYFNIVIASRRPCHIVVVNAAKIVKARQDQELADIIRHADLVGADGVPVVWASHLLRRPLPGRVNGTDLMEGLFELASQKGYRIFLLGATEEVISKVVELLRNRYPALILAGYRNGYFASPAEELETVKMVAEARVDILMLGMSTPMKEKWVQKYKHQLNIPVIHGVGGSFDIIGGLTRRAPKWMQVSGLEWAFRLGQEPRRMWKRYLITNSIFIWLVARAFLSRIFDQHDYCQLES
ncbi:MAG: WecB/TagA/CpsF family glycosyltransferase [Calditrichaeota bacterium]|nr:MAG: WecB/TagA/CpsF family glycosyltransferase [Calditrichota bacterium]